VAHGAAAVIAADVTAREIIYAVLRVRLLWPLYALLYLCGGMNLKMRWGEYRTRKSFGDAARPEVVRQTCVPVPPVPAGKDHAEIGKARGA
jgi:hypothetical protein